MLKLQYSEIRKHVPKFIRKLIENDKKPMGRWNNNKNINQIQKSIDNANVDHCGPCGTDKIDNRNIKK